MNLWKVEPNMVHVERQEFVATHTLTVVGLDGSSTFFDVCVCPSTGCPTYAEDPKRSPIWTRIRWERGDEPFTWTDSEGFVILKPGWYYATLEANTVRVRVA